MPVLAANTNVQLGPYQHGAILNITAPKSDVVTDFPTLNGSAIAISNVPKKVTLAQGNTYTFAANAAAITYNIS